jgi:hypothetical protein
VDGLGGNEQSLFNEDGKQEGRRDGGGGVFFASRDGGFIGNQLHEGIGVAGRHGWPPKRMVSVWFCSDGPRPRKPGRRQLAAALCFGLIDPRACPDEIDQSGAVAAAYLVRVRGSSHYYY